MKRKGTPAPPPTDPDIGPSQYAYRNLGTGQLVIRDGLWPRAHHSPLWQNVAAPAAPGRAAHAEAAPAAEAGGVSAAGLKRDALIEAVEAAAPTKFQEK